MKIKHDDADDDDDDNDDDTYLESKRVAHRQAVLSRGSSRPASCCV